MAYKTPDYTKKADTEDLGMDFMEFYAPSAAMVIVIFVVVVSIVIVGCNPTD